MFSARNVAIEPHSTLCVKTDISFGFSKKYFAKIYSRSGLSSYSKEWGAGVIGLDFRGDGKAVLHNLSNKQIEFVIRDRIAQVVFQKGELPNLEEVL